MAKKKITKEAEAKAAFRKTSVWKDHRKKLIDEQGGLDPITLCKLTKCAHCHHRDLSPENYTNIDEGKQVVLNHETHKVVHFLLRYIKKWHSLEVVERLVKEITFEAILNKYIEEGDEK